MKGWEEERKGEERERVVGGKERYHYEKMEQRR